MPAHRPDLSSFSSDLAARLPGTWTSTYQHHAAYKDQYPTTNQVWDIGHVHYIVSTYVLAQDAVLHGPGLQRLYVTSRPLYSRQFVVAPLEPVGPGIRPHHFEGVEEPHGIAVPDDPVRAAADVTRRVLPRYGQALHEVLHNTEDQPEPSYRPAPPQVSQVLTLTYYGDGVLGAPYASVPPDARVTLYAHGFQYHPHQAAFLLPATYGAAGSALRVQAVAQKLASQGIGVNLRHTTADTAPPPTTAQPAAYPAVDSSPAAHRR
ncbi:hypothetical protein [Streptomyces sp. NPDC059604]|uniref:hypothetical protein n=1 Tax=Streptomyces sp. NPDC059604 TaxID=3346881 RepID=UPI0036B14CC2